MRIVTKGWGREVVFADNELYAGKLLQFVGEGSRFSLHFHKIKDETWYVLHGEFLVTTMDLETAEKTTVSLEKVMHISPGLPHRLVCVSDGGTVLEVSTHDDPADNYRIEPGDSQK